MLSGEPYVAELASCADSDSIQYADNKTIYTTCRPNDILQKIHKFKSDIKKSWNGQRKIELFLIMTSSNAYPSPQKKKVNDKSYLICSNRKSTAEETTVKLLEVKFDQ